MWSKLLSGLRDGTLHLSTRRSLALLGGGLLVLVSVYLFRNSWSTFARGPSEVVGGIPGFYVIDNLWYHDKTFYLHDPSPAPRSFPSEDEMLSGFTKLVIDRSSSFSPSPSTRLKGVTFFLNEGAKEGWNGLYHYYHFAAENILGGFAALASVHSSSSIPSLSPSWSESLPSEVNGTTTLSGDPTLPSRIVIPWEGGWKDKWGENELVVNGIFPSLIDKDKFERMTGSGRWILFDRVVLIDRWASHRHNPSADFWNKMSLPIYDHPHVSSFFHPIREKLLSYYNIPTSLPLSPHPSTSETNKWSLDTSIRKTGSGGRPHKILYIDRQNSDRRLLKPDHEALVELLDLLGILVDVHIVELEDLGLKEQIKMVSDCSVMIGIHGNGLTHEMWMPEDATLIEIFPPGSFLRDYQSVAEVLHHPYYAIWNDTILTRDQWDDKGEQQAGAMHDGREIPLHVPVLVPILHKILGGRMKEEQR